MTLIIAAILVFAYLLISTEHITGVSRAAVAIFAGTLGWMLYIAYGSDFVLSQHHDEYLKFLDGAQSSSVLVKEYIAGNIFIKYVGRAAEVVLFLLATMSIVKILNNNGCFDFIAQLMKTRSSRRLLWTFAVVTFAISANLDNLTTTIMMLVVVHKVLPNRKQRMIFGSAVVLAANTGGALTVIGDPIGVVLWNRGAVTATSYSMAMALPCLVAWVLPTWLLGRLLPDRVDTEWISMPYRGDDTRLNVWQRLAMLLVGIGGLWFIPSFHSITKLSPFLGALCVLAVLWIVNEVFNHKLLRAEQMSPRRTLQVFEYRAIQQILFIMGLMLLLGVVAESGIAGSLAEWMAANVNNIWTLGAMTGAVSTVLDNFTTAATMVSLFDVQAAVATGSMADFAQNGIFWNIVAYTSAVGGNILAFGCSSGLALILSERMHVGWYFKHVGWRALAGFVAGYAVMYAQALW